MNINSWNEFFRKTKEKDYAIRLNLFLDKEYANYTCYPKRENMFNAFKFTPLDKVKVVIIGQDPYHEVGQAMGLSFSVPKGIKLPPSLLNIYKEIGDEFGQRMNYDSGDLTYLAKQGVLLLNSVLSVREGEANSHNIPEYEEFQKDVLEVLESKSQPIVYLLWGNNARKLKKHLHNPSHLILESAHPSPLSANRGGFFGNNHFIKANEYLKKNNLKPIEWVNN